MALLRHWDHYWRHDPEYPCICPEDGWGGRKTRWRTWIPTKVQRNRLVGSNFLNQRVQFTLVLLIVCTSGKPKIEPADTHLEHPTVGRRGTSSFSSFYLSCYWEDSYSWNINWDPER